MEGLGLRGVGLRGGRSGFDGRSHFVAILGAVALGHPDGLDALAIGEAKQVAHGAIGGDEALLDLRQAERIAFVGEALAQADGQCGNLCK